MPLTPAEIERKIGQLDNDVQSIYEMLSAIQGTQTRHTNRLHELDVKVDALDAKVDSLDTKVTGLEARIGTRLDALDTKMDTVVELLRQR